MLFNRLYFDSTKDKSPPNTKSFFIASDQKLLIPSYPIWGALDQLISFVSTDTHPLCRWEEHHLNLKAVVERGTHCLVQMQISFW